MTIPPDQIEARSQASAWSLSGSLDSAVKLCSGWVGVEACYTDRWATQLTGAPIRIADASGVVIDQTARTRGLPSYGVQDGDTETAALTELGRFQQAEVQRGRVDVDLVADSAGDAEADAAMQELGTALTRFRDTSLGALRPWVQKWEQDGILSIAEAQRDGVMRGLQSWWSSEADFWGGVSSFAIQKAQEAWDAYQSQPWYYKASPGLMMGAWGLGKLQDLFEGAQELAEHLPTIMAALRKLATGIVNDMQGAIESLMTLPGEFGTLFRRIRDTGQDWIERLVLIASETNAFEYTFRCCMAVVMNMTPNFWAEMFGVASGYLLPEVLIELILMVIGALSGGSTAGLIAARFATLTAKLTRAAAGARGLGMMLSVLQGFRSALGALARIGRGLHRAIAATAREASDRIVRLRHELAQLEFKIDHATLGMNGGNIRIVRKVGKPRILDGDSRKGWEHIRQRHIDGDDAAGDGDLFAPGTTRAQVQQAAEEAVSRGTRQSNPQRRIQTFERRMTVNGQRANYRVVVDSMDDSVITMFPILGGR